MFSMMMVGHLADAWNRCADVLADVRNRCADDPNLNKSLHMAVYKVKVPGTRPISSQLIVKQGKRHRVSVV